MRLEQLERPPQLPALLRRRERPPRRRIAVALHEIEPATFERCALIGDWLDDHGVDRVTLLVIPARDLLRSPTTSSSPPASGDGLARLDGEGDRAALARRRGRPARGCDWGLPLSGGGRAA